MISVRPFGEKDASALAAMMAEIAESYGAAVPGGGDIARELVGHARRVDILLAFDGGGALAGFATSAILFPVGGAEAFTYVQQVYVGRAARRLGVARRLMAAVARTALDRGCRRLEWATAADNAAARALYDGLGAAGTEKVQYVLGGDALDRLART
jgi:GNAT superfamily N-acetyltransferase